MVTKKTEENSKPISSGSNSEVEKLKEDFDMATGQIAFLNSVIVDLQHKNEKLDAKVQVLEMGIPSQEADDYNLYKFFLKIYYLVFNDILILNNYFIFTVI